MNGRPRLLDLFCGAGGAAKGYQRAGFYVVGVDIKPQPRYCGNEFVQGDAMDYCREHGREFGGIHASPQCQGYTWAAKRWRKKWPDQVADVRRALRATGLPYVIENVVGAPLEFAIILCGTMFGLRVIRHRVFESSHWLHCPEHKRHQGSVSNGDFLTVVGHGGESRDCTLAGWRKAMGIDWMTKAELVEAIPPAYTEYIGRQLMRVVECAK